ncbi:MAG TPA: DUF3052 domain-containing protein [Acidimicrobiia bacterium]|nr:DUF3052 domain-containing protein [Acidimicrobiia bacterium]
MTGYSGTPLPTKLGIKEGMTVGIIGERPPGFTLENQPPGVFIHKRLEPSSVFLIFATTSPAIEELFHQAMKQISAEGAIWVAWPKKSSGVETDLTEDTIRDLFLPTGMVDNKVCAIDETWSGLRFVVRKENRVDW